MSHVVTPSERSTLLSSLFGASQQDSFDVYIRHYEKIINHQLGRNGPFHTHEHVARAAKVLSNNALTARQDLESLIINYGKFTPAEKERAIGSLSSAVFMVECDSRDYRSTIFHNTAKWEAHESFVSFLNRSFHFVGAQPTVYNESRHYIHNQKALKLWKLQSRSRLRILGTNNILEHLQLDTETRTLKIFHHVAFLRAQLQLADGLPLNMDFEASLGCGCLPPQLMFETLLLNQLILLPASWDHKTDSLLEKLIAKDGFDPNMREYDPVRRIAPGFVFQVWARRLDELHDFVRQPPPSNALVAWFERHTSERNALTVAILGLFLSVVIGLLGLVVGILQLVLAWYAYKFPIDR